VRTIAVVNMKGGVAKTTTALCVAAGMAMRAKGGKPVLLVDGDAQSHSSLVMLERDAESPTLTEVLMDEAEAAEAIRPTRVKGLHILPATGSLANCTVLLKDETGRELRLRRALRSVERKYSACVIDSGPQLSLVTTNILKAVNELVVPVDAGLFSINGLGKLRDIVADVRRLLDHPELTIIGVALVRAQRNKQTIELESSLRSAHGTLVYRTTIPFATVVEQAHCSYRTVLEWAPASAVSVAYGKLIGEIMNGQSKKRRRGRVAQADSAA
jgi:chromosome partitioning protein